MTRLVTIILALLLIGQPGMVAQSQTPALNDALKQIEKLAEAEFASTNIGSLTIGVVSDKELIWTKSFGFADMEKKVPATKETVYRIGSITTQFTALMLLQLAEEGKLRLSDPVEQYFPEVNKLQGRFANAPPITLLQLANQTSGIAKEPAAAAKYTKGPVSDWERVLIEAIAQTKYDFEPGTHVAYSNMGYAILGAALSRAAKQSYVDYVHKRIFLPLEMTMTGFEPNEQMMARLSQGYEPMGDKVDSETAAREHLGRGYKVPNGAAYTTVTDLARFVSFELGGGPASVLKKSSLEQNLYKRIVVLTEDFEGNRVAGYGLGFMRRQSALITYGQAGGVAGYEAQADFEPVSRYGVILLRNAGGKSIHVSTSRLSEQVLKILAATRQGPKS
jgi:CubicO group peptidase (beta-lactamase class C family)